jgi:hypothetical protein
MSRRKMMQKPATATVRKVSCEIEDLFLKNQKSPIWICEALNSSDLSVIIIF